MIIKIFQVISIITLLNLSKSYGQVEQPDSEIIRKFDYAYSLIISADESTLCILTNDNTLEFYHLETMTLIQTIKVSRNAWLDKAFFYNENKTFFYDYGMQTNNKYKNKS